MESKISIPEEARRLQRILKRLGYTKENPYRPETPLLLEQSIDMPGSLDFAEAKITALWPDGKTVGFSASNQPDNTLVNSFQDYGDGNYIDTWWNGLIDIDGISARLEDDLIQKQKEPLLKRLARLLPAEGISLSFDREETVVFATSGRKKEAVCILSAWTEKGEPMVRYKDSYGYLFTEYAHDLFPSDIKEIIGTIKGRTTSKNHQLQ